MALKFFHRALILVAIPLIFELLFAASLIYMLRQVETEARKEEHVKQLCISMNSLMNTFIGTTNLLIASIIRRDSDTSSRFQTLCRNVPYHIARLRVLQADSPDDLKMLDKLEKQATFTTARLDSALRSLDEGDRTACILQLKSLQPLIDIASQELGELRNKGMLTVKDSPEIQSKIRQQMKLLLIAGIGLNVLVAAMLTIHFNKAATTRLAIIMENSRRLAAGEKLLPLVLAGDEIGDLDRRFHEMALSLNLAHETERLILESVSLGLVTMDSRGKISSGNPSFYEMFKFSVNEVEGKHFSILFPTTSRFGEPESIDSFLAVASKHGYERDAIRKDEQIFPVELFLTSFGTSAGDQLLAVIFDITQRRESEQMKQQLVSTISRDLRNPLLNISTLLNQAAAGELGAFDDRGQKMSAMAVRNCSRLLAMVNDLLSIEYSKSGSFALKKELTGINQLIERAIESVRVFADKQNVSLEFEPTPNIKIVADGDRIVQVLVNLLGNAIKFSPKGSAVRLTAETQKDSAVVRVIDRGRGVPAELKDAIFERFKQVKGTDATEAKGTGLGLAVCKSLIEQHGGTIAVESTEGEGSTFWFRLPIDANQQSGQSPKSNLLNSQDT